MPKISVLKTLLWMNSTKQEERYTCQRTSKSWNWYLGRKCLHGLLLFFITFYFTSICNFVLQFYLLSGQSTRKTCFPYLTLTIHNKWYKWWYLLHAFHTSSQFIMECQWYLREYLMCRITVLYYRALSDWHWKQVDLVLELKQYQQM